MNRFCSQRLKSGPIVTTLGRELDKVVSELNNGTEQQSSFARLLSRRPLDSLNQADRSGPESPSARSLCDTRWRNLKPAQRLATLLIVIEFNLPPGYLAYPGASSATSSIWPNAIKWLMLKQRLANKLLFNQPRRQEGKVHKSLPAKINLTLAGSDKVEIIFHLLLF